MYHHYFADHMDVSALILLVALLPDSRCKVDTSKVVYLALVSVFLC